MQQMIDLNTFANGALAERLNIEIQKAIENIADPNTDPKKARKVHVTLTLKTNENRTLSTVHIDTKTTLAPAKGVETEIMINLTPDGKVVGAELKSGIPGQTYFDGEKVRTDTGTPVEEIEEQSNKVVKFK